MYFGPYFTLSYLFSSYILFFFTFWGGGGGGGGGGEEYSTYIYIYIYIYNLARGGDCLHKFLPHPIPLPPPPADPALLLS